MTYWKKQALITGAVAFALAVAGTLPAAAEYYRYVDERGVVHYTDDQTQIPETHLPQSDTIKEKHDHLNATQKSQLIRKEREKDNLRRIRQAESIRLEQKRRQSQKEKERQALLDKAQTAFTLDENRILLPVSLGRGRFSTETNLLLDTGATRIVIHSSIAKRIGIHKYKRRQSARVTGGALIDVGLVELDYLRVGPYQLDKPVVWVVDYKGPDVKYKGLLGMNFLKKFNPDIDLEQKVIRWRAVK